MVDLFRRSLAILCAGIVGTAGIASAQPGPSGDPPGRVGRLAFVQGTVSFHDNDQRDWAPAVVNTPLTSGDALWTEPNARGEVSIAGTRVRLDSGTQLDMLVIDDRQTRMQVDQGRLDIKTFAYDARQPYEILTPRGTITLQQQGDYYVEAGSTQDPTRLGVRAGAAQIQAPNGQILAVRAGEVGEVFDDNGSPQLRTIPSAPPPMPAYWAERDRMVVYDQPPQYVTAGMTGYEDLNHYGSWSNDPEYGQVWAPRAVVAGWEPYRTGRWSYVQPWGWTWVDEQPWGFAPYHYGRWANRNNRWVWVPPQRDLQPVYAPALVAFVGGIELGVMLGQQSRAPVGWFPLGPREVYVPSYTTNRDYYRRINLSARVQEQILEDRWQRAERREAITANQQQQAYMNRRFATVVAAEDFTRSRPVQRAALRVAPERLATAAVAPVSAPPSPTHSINAIQAPGAPAQQGAQTGRQQGQAPAPQVNVPTAQTQVANMQAIGRPEPTGHDRPKAPGPQIATTRPNEPNAAHPGLPPLAPRTGAAPPTLQGQPVQPNTQRPTDNRAVTTPPPTGAPPPAGQPGQPRPPGQANLPPVREPNINRPNTNQAVEPTKPGEPSRGQPPSQATKPPPLPPRQGQAEPPKQGQPSAVTPAQQQHQATPATPATPPTRPVEPPRPQQAQPATPAPAQQHQATPATPATPPVQQHQATPATPATPPSRPVEPPRPQQAQPAAPPPVVHPTPPPQQTQAPAPQPPRQAAPPPQQSQAPQQQPQRQAAPPQQAQSPAPAPQQHAAPPPQQQHPAPQPQQGQKKDDDKK